jgi:hypothetical protein
MKLETRHLTGTPLKWAYLLSEGYQPVYTDPKHSLGPMFRKTEAVVEFSAIDVKASMLDVIIRDRIWVKERYRSVWDAYKAIPYEPVFKGVLVVTGTSFVEAVQRLCVFRCFGQTIDIPDAIAPVLGLQLAAQKQVPCVA